MTTTNNSWWKNHEKWRAARSSEYDEYMAKARYEEQLKK
jgi:hypothetical protein